MVVVTNIYYIMRKQSCDIWLTVDQRVGQRIVGIGFFTLTFKCDAMIINFMQCANVSSK